MMFNCFKVFASSFECCDALSAVNCSTSSFLPAGKTPVAMGYSLHPPISVRSPFVLEPGVLIKWASVLFKD